MLAETVRKPDFDNFKQVVIQYMEYYGLRGVEFIRPYYTDEVYFRGAGGCRYELGLEIWESFNDFLKGEDRESIPDDKYPQKISRIHEVKVSLRSK